MGWNEGPWRECTCPPWKPSVRTESLLRPAKYSGSVAVRKRFASTWPSTLRATHTATRTEHDDGRGLALGRLAPRGECPQVMRRNRRACAHTRCATFSCSPRIRSQVPAPRDGRAARALSRHWPVTAPVDAREASTARATRLQSHRAGRAAAPRRRPLARHSVPRCRAGLQGNRRWDERRRPCL